jgi:hypothetical protein
MSLPKIFALGTVLALAAGAAAPAQAETAAGTVAFAFGQVQATSASGQGRALHGGDGIFPGDTLQTRNGRLQIRFRDGGFMSLQPNSSFKVDAYRFSGSADGTEEAFFRLIRGGLRAITGLIGHRHKKAYELRTSVATIGIRGTAYYARLCAGDCFRADGTPIPDGLYAKTGQGAIVVTNAGGSIEVSAGQSSFVKSEDSAPEITTETPPVAAVEESSEKQTTTTADAQPQLVAGDQRTASGTQTAITNTSGVVAGLNGASASSEGTQTLSTGSIHNLTVYLNGGGQPIGGIDTDPVTGQRILHTIDLKAMTSVADAQAAAEAQNLAAIGNPAQITYFEQKPATIAEAGSDGILYWGRWSNGRLLEIHASGQTTVTDLTGYQSEHFVFGPDPGPLPTSGTATYTFVAGTQSTSDDGSTIGQGVTGGGITVDFGTATGGVGMTVSHGGVNYTVGGPLSFNGPFFKGNQDYAYGGSGACASTCPAQIDGILAGSGNGGPPPRAGLGYSIGETSPIAGVATFQLVPAP